MSIIEDRFSLAKVLELNGNKENGQREILQYHYTQAKLRIKDAYNEYNDYCYYRIPNFVTLLPPYKCNKVAELLVRYMTRKKFTCRIVHDANIIFEWKPKERPTDHIPVIYKSVILRVEYEAKNNNDYLFYEIPAILPEFPWYNVEDTAIVIGRKILDKGFIVKILENILFICWNKDQIESSSNVKIVYETSEDKKKKRLERIDMINENRYVDFINPKRDKRSAINFDPITKTSDFDVNKILHLYN
jgi:uncharacterized protein involved in tolerance to divalent cations